MKRKELLNYIFEPHPEAQQWLYRNSSGRVFFEMAFLSKHGFYPPPFSFYLSLEDADE